MSQPDDPSPSTPSDDTVLLLNRATLTVHTVRTAVHELNNILQMVSGSAELLQSLPDLPPSAARRIDAILRQSGRGQAILQSVTDLTRTPYPASAPLDAGQVLDAILESRRHEHTRAGIQVTVARPEGLRRLEVPRTDLEQILLNLVLNAEQALAGVEPRTIAVSLRDDDSVVEIDVADSGGGVAPAIDPFERFVTSRPGLSAGLGLPVVQLLAARSGGTVAVRREGGVTIQRLRLPATAS